MLDWLRRSGLGSDGSFGPWWLDGASVAVTAVRLLYLDISLSRYLRMYL